jgi:hypothetical protein
MVAPMGRSNPNCFGGKTHPFGCVGQLHSRASVTKQQEALDAFFDVREDKVGKTISVRELLAKLP